MKTTVIKGSNLLRFLTLFSLPWIWQWSYAVKPTELGLMSLVRQSYYKWWTKFDFKLVLIKIQEAIESFKKMEREYAPEARSTKLDLPSLADLKKQFPSASSMELKAKLFALVQSQLDIDFTDCLANNSSSNSLMEEDSGAEEDDFAQSNEDMENYLEHLKDEFVPKKDKGKAKE